MTIFNFDSVDARKVLSYGVLPALSGIGFYGTMYLAHENGLTKSLSDLVRGKTDVLPNTKRKLIRKWTGIKPIDDYLAFYIAFFLPPPRGSAITTLQGRHFIAQFSAMWSLLQLQAHQKGNSSTILSSMLLTGFGIQSIGAATIVPLFCATHLATSALSKTGILSQFGSLSGLHDTMISAIPASTVLTILVPMISGISLKSNVATQFWLNIFQVFYLFTELIERVAIPALGDRLPAISHLDATNRVYTFAQGLSTVSHLGVVGFILASKILPNLFPDGFKNVSFRGVFWPRRHLEKERDMFEARVHFLRWDAMISLGSFLLWAGACYAFALPAGAMSTADAVKFGGKVLARALITGPVGAAAWLLKERDLLLA